MMDARAALNALRTATRTDVPIDAITADEDLQPRVLEAVKFGQRTAVNKQSEQHTLALLRRLEGDAGTDFAPILLADTGDALLVVDGFHRLRAYEHAERNTIPARVFPMKRKTAAMAATLANLDMRALDMHPDQRRESLWQLMGSLSERGSKPLPISQRQLSALTGVARNTVSSMWKHMPHAAAREWNPDDCHPVTGFVRWHIVKRDMMPGFANEQDDEDGEDGMNARLRRESEQIADTLVQMVTFRDPRAFKRGLWLAVAQMESGAYDYDADDKAALEALRQARRSLVAHAGRGPDDDLTPDF